MDDGGREPDPAMRSLEPGGTAVVVGASGGLGGALVSALAAMPTFGRVVALSRTATPGLDPASRVWHVPLDLLDEASIAAAAALLPDPLRLIVVATGLLHAPGLQPEKTFLSLDPDTLLRSYRVNAVGPALVAKHMLPRLATPGRSVFAALSARVGSIGDNRSGGWHAYRASKAALNMILRNLAIELARRKPDALCVGLHPGTVDTGLSRPFQRGVAEGRLFTPDWSASRLLSVIDGLQASQNGCVLDWSGAVVPP